MSRGRSCIVLARLTQDTLRVLRLWAAASSAQLIGLVGAVLQCWEHHLRGRKRPAATRGVEDSGGRSSRLSLEWSLLPLAGSMPG